MGSCCITVGDLLCIEFKAFRLGSTQLWQQGLVSHERAYGFRNMCRVPAKRGGSCRVRPRIPHEICPSVFKYFLSLYSSQMVKKAGWVHFYHSFSSRLLVQKIRCPVQVHSAVSSVHCLSYNDRNLRSVKDLFAAAASGAQSLQTSNGFSGVLHVTQGKESLLGGLCMAHGRGSISLIWSVVLNSTYLIPQEGGDIPHPSPTLWFAWVAWIRLQGEEHPEGGVLPVLCGCHSLLHGLWACCGPEWSKGLCWWAGAVCELHCPSCCGQAPPWSPPPYH